jgi:hypothetical protein
MEPPEIRPAVRIVRTDPGDTVEFDTVGAELERRRADAATITLTAQAPPKLAKMLLPGERVTFGTAVHPVILILPVVLFVAIEMVFGLVLPWLGLQRGDAWLRTGIWPNAEIGLDVVLLALTAGLFVKRLFRFLSLRIVTTNRRIFAIRGVIIHRITPLGNTALAASTLSQGFLGRMLGYGSIELPLAQGTPERFRDMRDALELYREFQAVANGVDGDTWTPAARHTIIP